MIFLLNEPTHTGGRLRHAFIGIGFRERTEAYDFQVALHDHMKYFPSLFTLLAFPSIKFITPLQLSC